MNAVTEVSKYKAKLNGHLVRLDPATTKTLRAGKWYIRFFNNYLEVCYFRGQTFNSVKSNKDTRWLAKKHPDTYNGKQNIKSVYQSNSYWRRDGWHRVCYLADLGVHDVKHYRGAVLFEFTNKAQQLLSSLTSEQATVLLGHDQVDDFPIWDEEI